VKDRLQRSGSGDKLKIRFDYCAAVDDLLGTKPSSACQHNVSSLATASSSSTMQQAADDGDTVPVMLSECDTIPVMLSECDTVPVMLSECDTESASSSIATISGTKISNPKPKNGVQMTYIHF